MDIIKNDRNTSVGMNIRRIRKERGIGQTELIQEIDLEEWDSEVDLAREALVKIERDIQHIKASQLKAIKVIPKMAYDELLEQAAVNTGNRLVVMLYGMDGNIWNHCRKHLLGELGQTGGIRVIKTRGRHSVAGLNQTNNCLWKTPALVKKGQLFQLAYCYEVNREHYRMAGYGGYQYPVQCFKVNIEWMLSGRPGELISSHDTILQQS